MDILVSAQERHLDALEDSEAKRVAQDKVLRCGNESTQMC